MRTTLSVFSRPPGDPKESEASRIPEAPRHFEESQWGPEKRASEERDGVRGNIKQKESDRTNSMGVWD
ncbi:hypothetical protein EYF80_038314 [Liparis tanakae]|uniref:Uncharacterized protein n=1 Tax=Liparis tanakae TaxID=230148 RepID=A0A4Z2GFH6_9TELE|nr:hypothetical protein EYF80_038314 [Liparis tanakae]